MPTFIDESGDTGPSGAGGKPYFGPAAVWVPSFEDARTFREQIKGLRKGLGLRANYEFKFANTHRHPDQRAGFFSAALAGGFKFAFSSVDKTDSQWIDAGRHEMYWACATVS